MPVPAAAAAAVVVGVVVELVEVVVVLELTQLTQLTVVIRTAPEVVVLQVVVQVVVLLFRPEQHFPVLVFICIHQHVEIR